MSFFVTKCKGCGKPWAELATDMMIKYRFRRVEAGRAAPSVECMRFIEEHLHKCPPQAPLMTRKKAAGPAKESQKKAQLSRSGQKESRKPASATPAKKSRNAVEKPCRSKKSVDGAALLKAAIQHAESSTETVTGQPGQPDRISTTTNDGDGIMADATSCSQPLDGMENSADIQTKAIEQAGSSLGQQVELGNALPSSTGVFPEPLVDVSSFTDSNAETQAPGRAGGSPQPTTERATAIVSSSGGDEDEEMEDDHSDPASNTAATPASPTPVPAPAPASSSSTAVTNSSSGAWAPPRKCIVM
jgi:hypothetical protein